MTVQINYWMTPDDFLDAEKRKALIQAAIDVDSTIPGSGGTTLEIICDHSTLEAVEGNDA